MSGLSRTPGKRVRVNSPPRVRIPPSPPRIRFTQSSIDPQKPRKPSVYGDFLFSAVRYGVLQAGQVWGYLRGYRLKKLGVFLQKAVWRFPCP